MVPVFTADEVTNFEREVWSRCAEGYSGSFGVLTREAISELLNSADVMRGSRVLDVGTGNGSTAAAVRARGGTVIGVDFSTAMLAEARQRHPEIEFKECNAEKLPFSENEFDAVVSNFTVHHMGRPQRCLSEARRVLHNGGKIAFTVWAAPEKLAAFGLFFAAVGKHLGEADLPHGPLFGVSDFDVFHEMVREAGFRDSRVVDVNIDWCLDSIDPFLKGFSEWANLQTVPANIRMAIEADVREASREYKSDGKLVIPNPGILVSGLC